MIAHVGIVVIAVEGTVLHACCGGVPRVLRAGVLLWSRPEPRSRVAPMPFEGPEAERVQGVGGIAAGVVPGMSAHGVAGSHSVAIVPGVAKQ